MKVTNADTNELLQQLKARQYKARTSTAIIVNFNTNTAYVSSQTH